jgi:hypothetical protein
MLYQSQRVGQAERTFVMQAYGLRAFRWKE